MFQPSEQSKIQRFVICRVFMRGPYETMKEASKTGDFTGLKTTVFTATYVSDDYADGELIWKLRPRAVDDHYEDCLTYEDEEIGYSFVYRLYKLEEYRKVFEPVQAFISRRMERKNISDPVIRDWKRNIARYRLDHTPYINERWSQGQHADTTYNDPVIYYSTKSRSGRSLAIWSFNHGDFHRSVVKVDDGITRFYEGDYVPANDEETGYYADEIIVKHVSKTISDKWEQLVALYDWRFFDHYSHRIHQQDGQTFFLACFRKKVDEIGNYEIIKEEDSDEPMVFKTLLTAQRFAVEMERSDALRNGVDYVLNHYKHPQYIVLPTSIPAIETDNAVLSY